MEDRAWKIKVSTEKVVPCCSKVFFLDFPHKKREKKITSFKCKQVNNVLLAANQMTDCYNSFVAPMAEKSTVLETAQKNISVHLRTRIGADLQHHLLARSPVLITRHSFLFQQTQGSHPGISH